MKHPFEQQFKELHSFIEKGDVVNKDVSEKGTYWHLNHSLQILIGISELLESSKPEDYKPKWTLPKFIIMNTGYIPRGKGRAPKQTLPEGETSKEQLFKMFEKAQKLTGQISQLPADKHFKHPLFGSLKLKKTIKFMGIQTHHHLKIMRDIVG